MRPVNLTSISTFSLLQLPSEIHNTTAMFLTPEATSSLSKTCSYFNKFLKTEVIWSDLLAAHFPFFRPTRDIYDNFSPQYCYTRLIAGFSVKPSVVFCGSSFDNERAGDIEGMKLSHDGTKLLTLAWGNVNGTQIRLFDLNTRRYKWTRALEGRFQCSSRLIDCLQITPNGKYALTPNPDGTIDFIDFETGENLQTLAGHQNGIRCIQISSDGKYAYVGVMGSEKLLQWDLRTGDYLKTFLSPQIGDDQSYVQQISQDGTTAISVLKDGTLLFWSLETSDILQTLKGHPQPKSRMRFISVKIASDKTKAISSCGDHDVRLWDLKTGKYRHLFNKDDLFSAPLEREFKEKVHYMQATPDMKRAILRGSNNEIILLDLEKCRVQLNITIPGNSITNLQITPEGTQFILGSEDIILGSFCQLPEERLSTIARSFFSNLDGNHERLASLPEFAQKEIRSIDLTINNMGESIDIYNAIQVALPSIRWLLRIAEKQPDLAPFLISEAAKRINNLSPSITDAVYRNFDKIQKQKGKSAKEVLSNPEFAACFEDGSLIADGIEAITSTIAEFKAKLVSR